MFFIADMLYVGYFNILYYLSRLWPLTAREHSLQVHRGQCEGQCQLSL